MPDYVPDPEMKRFWETEVESIIESITNGFYPLPAVQMRYFYNRSVIERRFGMDLAILIHDKKSEVKARADKVLPLGSTILNGQPIVSFFVPAIVEAFQSVQNTHPDNFRQVFQNSIIIGFIHELDHLAHCDITEGPCPLNQLVPIESAAWAETCEKTIRWFVEGYHEEIYRADSIIYSAWVKSGRNAQEPEWLAFIKGLYGSLTLPE